MIAEKSGYRPDNTDAPPEGFAYSLIQRFLNQPSEGIKQVVRACVDDSGAKASGANTDETDETNNYEGFIVSGQIAGSLHETLQGRNIVRSEEEKKETLTHLADEKEMIHEAIKESYENVQEFMKKALENLRRTNEHFYPFSTISKS